MGRRPSPHWDKREQCYRTDAGGRPHYFRGIARDDHSGIAAAFAEFLEVREAERRPAVLTVEDVCTAFVSVPRGRKPKTIRTHKDRLIAWSEWDPGDGQGILAGRPAKDVGAKLLRQAMRQWTDQGWSAHYCVGIAASVRAAFAWAASEDGGQLIPANPFVGIKVPTIGRSPERYAERREVAAFLRFAWRDAGRSKRPLARINRLTVLLMRIVAQTGARPGELCSAWWEDLDEVRCTLTLPPDRHKTGSKTLQDRVIYLTPILVRSILREKAKPDRHPVAIFVHKRRAFTGLDFPEAVGVPWGRFLHLPNGRLSFDANSTKLASRVRALRSKAIAEAIRRKDAGEPIRGLDLIKDVGDNRFVLYQLRHTTASDHLMSGGDVSTVAQLLGTSAKQIQSTYGHLLDDHLSRASTELTAKRRARGKP